MKIILRFFQVLFSIYLFMSVALAKGNTQVLEKILIKNYENWKNKNVDEIQTKKVDVEEKINQKIDSTEESSRNSTAEVKNLLQKYPSLDLNSQEQSIKIALEIQRDFLTSDGSSTSYRNVLNKFAVNRHLITKSHDAYSIVENIIVEILFLQKNYPLLEKEIALFISTNKVTKMQKVYFETKLADALDQQGLFLSAYEKRLSSLKTYNQFSPQESASSHKDLLKILIVKLSWSAYRAERYSQALVAIKDFAKYGGTFPQKDGASFDDEMERIAAIAWLETKNISFLMKWLQEDERDGVSRRVTLHIMRNLLRNEFYSELEKLSAQVELHFVSSVSFLDYLKVRFSGLDKNKFSIQIANLADKYLAKISESSPWYKTHASHLSSSTQNLRKEIFETYGVAAYQFFYLQGEQTGASLYYLKCAELTKTMLREPGLTLERGQVLSQDAECLFSAGKWGAARDSAQEILNRRTNEEDTKYAYALLVKIGRKETEKESRFESPSYQSYERAVDSYVNRYPWLLDARIALLESGLRRQKWKDFDGAVLRLEKLCRLVPKEENVELEQCLGFWSQAAYEHPNDEKSSQFLEGVENFSREIIGLKNTTLRKVTAQNASALRRYARTLRKQGKLEDAFKSTTRWVNLFPQNIDSPYLLLEASRFYASSQDWDNVEKYSEYGVQKYGYHEVAQELNYWYARAGQAKLKFDIALQRWKLFALINPIREKHDWLPDGMHRLFKLAYELKDDEWLVTKSEEVLKIYTTPFSLSQKAEWLSYAALAASRSLEFEKALKLARITLLWSDNSQQSVRRKMEFVTLKSKLELSKHARADQNNLSNWIHKQVSANPSLVKTDENLFLEAIEFENKSYFDEIEKAQSSRSTEKLSKSIDDLEAAITVRRKYLYGKNEVVSLAKLAVILNLMRDEAIRQLGFSLKAESYKQDKNILVTSLLKDKKVAKWGAPFLISQQIQLQEQKIDPEVLFSLDTRSLVEEAN